MLEINLFGLFVDKLDENGIDYIITGSVAAIVYGEPRLTHDIDIVIMLKRKHVESFMKLFPLENYYCPPIEVIINEMSRNNRGHFNLIHHKTGFKADIYFTGNDDLQHWAMKNKKKINFLDKELNIAPPEYVILKKLEFYKEGGAEKHILDIKSMIENSSEVINFVFLENEIASRGLNDVWLKIKR